MTQKPPSEAWVKHPNLGFARASFLPEKSSEKSIYYFVDETDETLSFPFSSLSSNSPEIIPIAVGTQNDEDLAEIYNLTTLLDLNQATLLETLNSRFDNREIYTFTGSILIAINPFERLKKLYSKKVLEKFIVEENIQEPHVYCIGKRAFEGMLNNNGRNQSVLVSGESGAGKTVTTKIVMEYMTSVSERNDSETNKNDVSSSQKVCNAVLQANPLLEAFGNAKTLRNDNSSRFGKLIQLQFEPARDKPKLIGASIDTYLLEKARVLRSASGERSYHIFYELAAGASPELKKKISFPDIRKCEILNKSGTYKRKDVDDKKQFQDTLLAMNTVGISPADQENIFKVVSAVLYLGNINFTSKQDNPDAATFDSDSQTKKSVEKVCELLNVEPSRLESSFCSRAISAGSKSFQNFLNSGNEALSKEHTVEQAIECRDALQMTLYERLFMWLVWRVNQKLGEEQDADGGSLGSRLSQKLKKLEAFQEKLAKNKKLNKKGEDYINDWSISCLDVFGFEVFKKNSFEQLCINYCNEVLQQQFNNYVFKNEQKFYEEEGVEWKHISFPDNIECIRMIEGYGKKIPGLLKLLDEECLYPKGSDKSLHLKLMKNLAIEQPNLSPKNKLKKLDKSTENSKSGYFLVNSRTQKRGLKFSIQHFASEVEYSLVGFCEKNKNELRQEAVDLLRSSQDPLVSTLLPDDGATTSQDSTQAGQYFQKQYEKSKRKKKQKRRMSLMRSSLHRHDGGKNMQKIQQKTVSRQFKDQLYQAMRHINASQPHYVRCIKPNDEDEKSIFERIRVLEQLNYSGVLEVVRVSRAGYSTRFGHDEFLGLYKCFADGKDQKEIGKIINIPRKKKERKELCNRILKKIGDSGLIKPMDDFLLGKTKVLLRSDGYLKLMNERSFLLEKFAVKIQTWYRTICLRRSFIAKREKTLFIQRVFRGYKARKQFVEFRTELEKKRRIEKERLEKERLERERIAEEERKERERKEAEERKRVEEERLRLEAEERAREEEKLREEEARRLELERIKEEKQRIIEEAAAIKIQSVFRVVLAQKHANQLYELKQEQEDAIDDAANMVIAVFRENMRQKRLAQELEELEALEREEEEELHRQEQSRIRRKKMRQRKRASRVSSNRKSSNQFAREENGVSFTAVLDDIVQDQDKMFVVMVVGVPAAFYFLALNFSYLMYLFLFAIAVVGGAITMLKLQNMESRQPVVVDRRLNEGGFRPRSGRMSVESKMRNAIETGSFSSKEGWNGHLPSGRRNVQFRNANFDGYDPAEDSFFDSSGENLVTASNPVFDRSNQFNQSQRGPKNGSFRITKTLERGSNSVDKVGTRKSKRQAVKNMLGRTFKRKKKGTSRMVEPEFPDF
eukprot:maker-scaffold_23-snap-gene-4.59-mRNA-1 protein AED:0.21 eAED:0.22 QI:0/0.5/0/1/1/1/3/0/1359